LEGLVDILVIPGELFTQIGGRVIDLRLGDGRKAGRFGKKMRRDQLMSSSTTRSRISTKVMSGYDVVLNSLDGDTLQKSLNVLKLGGKLPQKFRKERQRN
jgi:hypothetical protein